MKRAIVIFLLLVGCRASKESTYIEKVKDSTVRTIVLESKNVLQVNTICDSIGNPISFEQEIKTGNTTTKVTVNDNTLQVESSSPEIVYKDREVIKEVVSEKTTEIPVVPKWAWWTMFLQFMVIIGLVVLMRFKY